MRAQGFIATLRRVLASDARRRYASPPARSLTVTDPTAARSTAVTRRRPDRERSPPARGTTTATQTASAPGPPAAVTSPTPCDEPARSLYRSRDSATLAPRAPLSATSPTPTTVPQHTPDRIQPDRRC